MDNYHVIFRDEQGRELTLTDIQNVSLSGIFAYQIVNEVPVPARAMQLHQQGRELGQQGDYDEALKFFEQAYQLAPGWPYPLYDMAYTYLLQENWGKAEEYYARVDAMAPRGFFTTKTALDILRRERTGRVKAGIYLGLLKLEWLEDVEIKRSILDQVLKVCPELPHAWKELAMLLENDDDRVNAINQGLAYQPDPETKGMLLANKALILYRQGQRSEAISILARLALDPASPLDVEYVAKAVLANLLKKDTAPLFCSRGANGSSLGHSNDHGAGSSRGASVETTVS